VNPGIALVAPWARRVGVFLSVVVPCALQRLLQACAELRCLPEERRAATARPIEKWWPLGGQGSRAQAYRPDTEAGHNEAAKVVVLVLRRQHAGA